MKHEKNKNTQMEVALFNSDSPVHFLNSDNDI